jgi:hypothetical protein
MLTTRRLVPQPARDLRHQPPRGPVRRATDARPSLQRYAFADRPVEHPRGHPGPHPALEPRSDADGHALAAPVAGSFDAQVLPEQWMPPVADRGERCPVGIVLFS